MIYFQVRENVSSFDQKSTSHRTLLDIELMFHISEINSLNTEKKRS